MNQSKININNDDWQDVCCDISVQNLDSLDNLNFIADALIQYSQKIDENIEKYDVDLDCCSGPTYSVNVLTPNEDDLEDVFRMFYGHPILESKLVTFTQNLIQWCKANDSVIWQCDETLLAETAAYALCIQDLKYLNLYCEALEESRRVSEAGQFDHIDALIHKHGLCTDIIRLLGKEYSDHGIKNEWEKVIRSDKAMRHTYLDSLARVQMNALKESDNHDSIIYAVSEASEKFILDETEREEWFVVLAEKIRVELRTYLEVSEGNPYTITLDDVVFDHNTGEITRYLADYKNIIIPDVLGTTPVTTIGDYAFHDHGLTNVVIPRHVTVIGRKAFADNALINVVIPNSVDVVGYYAFYRNTLTNVTLPDSVTLIDDGAFSTNMLTNITIPHSVTSIGNRAFFENNLKNVLIPSSVISIGSDIFCKDSEEEEMSYSESRLRQSEQDKSSHIFSDEDFGDL